VVSTDNPYSFTVTKDSALVANFAIKTYDVTVSAGTGGTASGTDTYDCGETATVTATPSDCYSFVNWTSGGVVISADNPYSFTVTKDSALVANFAIKTYDVTVSAGTGGTASGTDTYNCGETATVTATPSDCYSFVNWTSGGGVVSTDNPYSFTVTKDSALVANFAINYTVYSEFDAENCEFYVWDTRYYNTSGSYTYLYKTVQGCDSLVTMHLTIHPKKLTQITETVDEDDLPYDFYGRPLNDAGIYTHKLETVHGCDSIIELTLLVGNTKAVIIATSGPGGRITPAGVFKITIGNSQVFYFIPDPGYKLESVIVDGVSVPASVISGTYTFSNLQSSHTIHVTFITEGITITATAGPNGTISPAGVIKIAEGKSQAFTFKPATGYKIETVLIDGVNNPTAVSTGMYTFSKVTESHTIHVTFDLKAKGGIATGDEGTSDVVEVYSHLSTVYINAGAQHFAPEKPAITVEVYDMLGRRIHQSVLADENTAISLNVPTGIYAVRLVSPNETILVKKVSLTKF